MSVGSTVGHSGSHGCRNSVANNAKIACHGISNVTKSQVYHIWSGIPGPTRQFPLAISLSIKLELLGLLELTSLENGFLLSKRKESTPYSHHNEERNKLTTLLDRCHWKKLRCARQGIEQRRPKGTFLFPQAYFRLPFVRWQTRNPTRDYRTSWRSVDVNICSLLFRLPSRVLYQCRHQPMHSLSKVLI